MILIMNRNTVGCYIWDERIPTELSSTFPFIGEFDKFKNSGVLDCLNTGKVNYRKLGKPSGSNQDAKMLTWGKKGFRYKLYIHNI